ncbi:uncharacterized protein MELLADRAFT_72353 [Melampsora larici-populina 98AG31]|uniref:Uncharacterized protein n=1 Tax=Melampsora larici-populina (strain 98AG31 / pathotype 3-4-7) TaxID=747676 RepID=F4RSV0_MELLP|nr:uncharacterized protein MELLADRAFT_72353 [Melampsora larici-populina 98AG31]EGG04543.1 hypothetical protein MELLADRAFT_72353 [Melampsora larici-populina 98AG31]
MLQFHQMASTFYVSAIFFLCIIYLPLCAFALGNGSSSSLVDQCRNADADQIVLNKHAETVKARKKLILFQAFLVATGTLAHAPNLLAQLRFKSEKVFVDTDWWLLTLIGLHLPSSIWCNGLLIFLNLNLDPQASRNNRQPFPKIQRLLPTFSILRLNSLNRSEGNKHSENMVNSH